MKFEVLQTAGRARRGRLGTPHGVIETPAFMPVGTLGAVKGVTPDQLENAGASVMLCNLYHLAVRPGIDTIERLGGLHAWNGWRRPILTDSGGFQVMSLAKLRALDEGGVTFRSHVDGAALRFSPEIVVDLQRRLGVDVAMILDECAPWPVSVEGAAAAVDRTELWARRAREEWASRPGTGGLFGIVQGSVYPELRDRAVASIRALDFDGVAIGGVSVGEPAADRRRVVEHTAPQLPAERPRYLMGVGTPLDLLHGVLHGIDLFDCVLPSRNARHGMLYGRDGVVRIKNACYREDPGPIDPACGCPVCQRGGRAFLHHLIRSGEITGAVLATLHNLRFFLDFMGELRQALASGSLDEFASSAMRRLGSEGRSPSTPST
ncbi:MAG: tRNA guanosine(34) transglycosylase Tgt [Acidobacteriota bacterium]